MPFSKFQNVWDIFMLIFLLLLSQFEKQLSEVGELTQKARILSGIGLRISGNQSACNNSLLSAYCILDTAKQPGMALPHGACCLKRGAKTDVLGFCPMPFLLLHLT